MTDKPAQSDAPGAAEFWESHYRHKRYTGQQLSLTELQEFAEAYAALRTAQADAEAEHHAEISRQSQLAELAATKRAETAEAKVAQLEREREQSEFDLAAARLLQTDLATESVAFQKRASAAETALSKARNTNRELNRLNQELKAAWNADTDRKQWFRYYKAAVSLFGDMATRAETAEAALSEARERAIQELIAVAEHSAVLLAQQEPEITKTLPCADGFVAGGVAMATRLAEGFRKLLAGASGAAGKGGAECWD